MSTHIMTFMSRYMTRRPRHAVMTYRLRPVLTVIQLSPVLTVPFAVLTLSLVPIWPVLGSVVALSPVLTRFCFRCPAAGRGGSGAEGGLLRSGPHSGHVADGAER